jgi:hypothetical protein
MISERRKIRKKLVISKGHGLSTLLYCQCLRSTFVTTKSDYVAETMGSCDGSWFENDHHAQPA